MTEVDDDDIFHDAVENIAPISTMDLATAIDDCKLAVNLFFNNKFNEAMALMQPWIHQSMYHALGNGTIMFMQAVMTFEPNHLETANEAINVAIEVCGRFRKKNSISESFGKMIKKPNYDAYTQEEVHAEICYGECLLIKSLLTFMEDETLMSFVKGALKIRSCFQSYRECFHILKHRNWGDDPLKIHFESGVKMGVGAYHLMISVLPNKILKLLEFIGFHGNRSYGLQELENGYNLKGSLRHVLCVMVLLNYHLFISYILSYQEGDLALSERILNYELQLFPQGAWFLFLKGRLEFVKGNFEEAINLYTRSWKSQAEWTQFHHICFWELTFANLFQLKWEEAVKYPRMLLQDSKWSRTIYAYQVCAIMLMMKEDLSNQELSDLDKLMGEVPQWKQRIAGKSLPMEKFVVKKSERYFAQGKDLVLPAIELAYFWNGFKIMAKRPEIIQRMLVVIEKTGDDISRKNKTEYYTDNVCLIQLLKGMCLKHLNSPLQAEECFRYVLTEQKNIKEDHYLVPFSLVELALLLMAQGHLQPAKQYLETAKNQYKGYNLESRLHFRIHSAMAELQDSPKSSPAVPEGIMETTHL